MEGNHALASAHVKGHHGLAKATLDGRNVLLNATMQGNAALMDVKKRWPHCVIVCTRDDVEWYKQFGLPVYSVPEYLAMQ